MIAHLGFLSLVLAVDAGAAPRPCRQPIPRTQPCAPSDSEIAAVTKSIADAMVEYRMFVGAAQVERGNRTIASDGDFNALESWETSKYEFLSARRNAAKRFDDAIANAALTYGIRPSAPRRHLTESPLEGVVLEWSPRAWLEDGTVYRVPDIDGNLHFLPGLRSNIGEESGVRSNGDILLDVDIFARAAISKDPMDFALILAFETARYEGVSRGESPKEIQLRGIEAELAAARAIGAPQKRINRLNAEWASLFNDGVARRALPELTDYFEHVRLSNVWQGELEAERQGFQRNLDSQREQRAAQEREARRRRELDELGQSLWGGLDSISERICGASQNGIVPDSLYMDWIRWRNGNYLAFSRELPIVDLADVSIVVGCPEFLKNQILMARRRGYGHGVVTFEWMAEAVRESYRRSHPTIPTWPSPPPSTVTLPDSPPDAFPDADVPRAPSVPHCRYHPWCQDKTPPPQDN